MIKCGDMVVNLCHKWLGGTAERGFGHGKRYWNSQHRWDGQTEPWRAQRRRNMGNGDNGGRKLHARERRTQWIKTLKYLFVKNSDTWGRPFVLHLRFNLFVINNGFIIFWCRSISFFVKTFVIISFFFHFFFNFFFHFFFFFVVIGPRVKKNDPSTSMMLIVLSIN